MRRFVALAVAAPFATAIEIIVRAPFAVEWACACVAVAAAPIIIASAFTAGRFAELAYAKRVQDEAMDALAEHLFGQEGVIKVEPVRRRLVVGEAKFFVPPENQVH